MKIRIRRTPPGIQAEHGIRAGRVLEARPVAPHYDGRRQVFVTTDLEASLLLIGSEFEEVKR